MSSGSEFQQVAAEYLNERQVAVLGREVARFWDANRSEVVGSLQAVHGDKSVDQTV